MPVWAAIVIALGSGSVGAWLSGWYQARNDRQERFRERMITAADDFGVAASEGFVALRTARAAVRHDPPPQIQIATDNAWAKRDVLLPLSARLDLLFGPGSEPGLLAAGVTHELAKGCNSLNTDLSGAEQALLDGPEELRKFQRAAFAGIRDPAPRSATVRETRSASTPARLAVAVAAVGDFDREAARTPNRIVDPWTQNRDGRLAALARSPAASHGEPIARCYPLAAGDVHLVGEVL